MYYCHLNWLQAPLQYQWSRLLYTLLCSTHFQVLCQTHLLIPATAMWSVNVINVFEECEISNWIGTYEHISNKDKSPCVLYSDLHSHISVLCMYYAICRKPAQLSQFWGISANRLFTWTQSVHIYHPPLTRSQMKRITRSFLLISLSKIHPEWMKNKSSVCLKFFHENNQ